jgi:hypothetical protein
MRILLLTVFLFIGIAGKAQTILYVDSSASSSGAGTSWSTAFKTLGDALQTVNSASTSTKFVINVAKGTYYPTGVVSDTTRDIAFCIFRGGVKVYGGFPSGGGTRNVAANRTVLSGNIGASGNNDNSLHIMLIASLRVNAYDSIILNGLEFREAYANFPASRFYDSVYLSFLVSGRSGGAIRISGPANCLISQCNFYQNRADVDGGAVDIQNGKATFYDCIFDDNAALGTSSSDGSGGAVNVAAPGYYTNFLKCAFRNCAANFQGAAIYNASAGSTIDSCEFTSNSAGTYGGAVFIYNSLITNSSFISNRASGTAFTTHGGAIYGTPNIIHCSFIQNFSRSEGGAVQTISGAYFSNCTFDGNSTKGRGGAAVVWGHAVDSCLFINNKADTFGGALVLRIVGFVNNSNFYLDTAGVAGGAIYCEQGIANWSSFSNCIIGKNVATYGAGIYTEHRGLLLDHSIISGNMASDNGGGLYSSDSFVATNCLFSGNKAAAKGGAIFDSSANPTLTNCTLARDSAANGNGIYNTNSSPVIRNSIVWEGTGGIANVNSSSPSVTYSIVEGGYSGTGNSSGNPLFINPLPASAVPDTGGVFDILPCSPAVGTGTYVGPYTGTFATDIALRPRLFGTTVDRGAYESQANYPTPITGKSVLCANDTIRLSIPFSGNWTSSNLAIASVDTNGVVRGLSGGIDTIIFSTGVGTCQNVVTRIITVNAGPGTAPISGRTSVCQYDTIHLSSSSGGVWFHLQPGIATISSSGVFTGVNPGIDTVRYTRVTSNGCRDTVSSIIRVDSVPVVAPITGPGGVCVHGMVTMSNATPGGVWSNARSSVCSVSASGRVTALSGGVDTIKYTVTNTVGCSAQATKIFTVDTVPVLNIAPDRTFVCMKENVVFTATPSGGKWSSSDTSVLRINPTGTITPRKAGSTVLNYSYTSVYGCIASLNKTLNVIQFDTSVTVSGVQLRANQSGASYQWLDCDHGKKPVPGATNRTFTSPVNGHFSVEIRYGSCVDTSGCHAAIGVGVSGEIRHSQGFAVIPNPASATVMIRVERTGNYELSLKDISGRVLLRRELRGSEMSIELRDFAAGVYFIELVSETEKLIRKLNILR